MLQVRIHEKGLYWPIWPAMSTLRYMTAESVRGSVRISKIKGTSNCSYPKDPLEYIGVDILWLLSRTKDGNRFGVVKKDHWSKLNKNIGTSKNEGRYIYSHYSLVLSGDLRYYIQGTSSLISLKSYQRFLWRCVALVGWIISPSHSTIRRLMEGRNVTTPYSFRDCDNLCPSIRRNGTYICYS